MKAELWHFPQQLYLHLQLPEHLHRRPVAADSGVERLGIGDVLSRLIFANRALLPQPSVSPGLRFGIFLLSLVFHLVGLGLFHLSHVFGQIPLSLLERFQRSIIDFKQELPFSRSDLVENKRL
jgi:hypothetical protein